MRQAFQLLTSTITQFFYPSFCLHCNVQTFGRDKWICRHCFEQIEWIDQKLLCQACGKPKPASRSFRCPECREEPLYLTPFGSCFFPEGPAYCLHEQLRVYQYESIAKIFASLLVIRWKQLSWPFPDKIIPVPTSRLEILSLKRQPSYLIAKAFSQILKAPFYPILTTRERGNGFTYQTKTFFHKNLTDKKVLLITDMVRGSQNLQQAQNVLKSLFPAAIYTLTLFDKRT
jgi:predicted amidophosphoribosyltransferase